MKLPKTSLTMLAFASLAACQQSGGGEGNQAAPANGMPTAGSASASGGSGQAIAAQTIADTLSKSPEHSSLLNAVKAAGLTETLSGAGPYTVFAPTNAAFQKLPA